MCGTGRHGAKIISVGDEVGAEGFVSCVLWRRLDVIYLFRCSVCILPARTTFAVVDDGAIYKGSEYGEANRGLVTTGWPAV